VCVFVSTFGLSCFVSLIWCQQFAWLIRAAIFRLPPAFGVCLCHKHLWSVLFSLIIFIFATGICVRSLSFAAFSVVVIRVRFQIGYPVGRPTNSALKQTPFGIPP